jgi:hypothetical protein
MRRMGVRRNSLSGSQRSRDESKEIPNNMWNKFKRENPICEQYREALEELRPEIDRLTACAELSNSHLSRSGRNILGITRFICGAIRAGS